MAQTHQLPARLPFGKECWVYHSVAAADGAIVFVHGLHGHATETWMQFQSLLDNEVKCNRKDLYFFGYHSMRRSAASSASWLFELLEAVATAPEETSAWPARPKGVQYRKILVVAHSLGAIVSRRAFLTAWDLKREWTAKLQLMLYAPAHLGGRPLKLIPKRMKRGIEFLFPTLEELLDDSKTIRKLQDETRKALGQKGSEFLKAVKVVHGRKDNIISEPGATFCADPQTEWIEANHITVCKPSHAFMPPLDKLRGVL